MRKSELHSIDLELDGLAKRSEIDGFTLEGALWVIRARRQGNKAAKCTVFLQRRLVTRRTALWVNITICFSLHDLSCRSDLRRGDRRSVKIGISCFFSMLMLNVECYSAPQLLGLPYQHMMIDEDYKNMSVFTIESQSKDESTSDRSVLYSQTDICSMSSIFPDTF